MAVYRKTGKITPVDSLHATDMRFGIGMEKLDRDVFDPSKAYDQRTGRKARAFAIGLDENGKGKRQVRFCLAGRSRG